MKVLNVYSSKYGGGAQAVFKNTIKGLTDIDTCDSFFASRDKDSDVLLKKSFLGISNIFSIFCYIHKNNITHFHAHGGLDLGILLPMVYITLKFKGDVALFFTSHNYALICPSQKRYNYKKNKVCDACKPSAFKYLIKNCEDKTLAVKCVKLLYSVVLKFCLSFSSAKILTPSIFAKKIMSSYKIKDVEALYNPISPVVNYVPTKNNTSVNGICFLGRFVEEKGLFFLVNELRQNKDYYIDKVIHLIGDGPVKNQILKEIIELNINFEDHGFCDSIKIQEVLNSCRITVVPSLWDETFGLVVAESVLSGCIPVVSNRGALKEVTEIAQIGKVFNIDDPIDFHIKVSEAYDDYLNQDWVKVHENFKGKVSIENYLKRLIYEYNK